LESSPAAGVCGDELRGFFADGTAGAGSGVVVGDGDGGGGKFAVAAW